MATDWAALRTAAGSTETGARLASELEQRKLGAGPPHTDASLRLFGKSEADVRVTLYRDAAAWCPYCQKVWLLLEEKQIPYKIERINMRSYGDKPAWFLQKVPSGLLPVLELDGEMLTESLVTMQVLEREYSERPTLPQPGAPGFDRANQLLALERQLFRAWCDLVFRPSPFGTARRAFEQVLGKVEAALGDDLSCPWLLPGDRPSIVDLQYISHVERMVASCLFWKGLDLRNNPAFPRLEAWLRAFEARPAYLASKSDMYTHVWDIPPQYGDGVSDNTPEVRAAQAAINGGSSWRLPLAAATELSFEPLPVAQQRGEAAARHEAAWKLAGNAEKVARFAARGPGQPGRKAFSAPLADPTATPLEAAVAPTDAALRCVVAALLDGSAPAPDALRAAAGGMAREVGVSLRYLQQRVGVPRDMSLPAATALRSYLTAACEALGQ